MSRKAVLTKAAPPPLPQFSQAIKCNGMLYCSGNVGVDPATMKLVDGGIKAEAVSCVWPIAMLERIDQLNH